MAVLLEYSFTARIFNQANPFEYPFPFKLVLYSLKVVHRLFLEVLFVMARKLMFIFHLEEKENYYWLG